MGKHQHWVSIDHREILTLLTLKGQGHTMCNKHMIFVVHSTNLT